MSFSIHPKNGVRLKTIRKHGMWISAVIIAVEAVFSLLLYISLAERVFVVMPASASYGVPQYISYQGMLTDTSGNPLGGAGATYCFRYSIWDAASSGNQLWPSGTPGNSTTTVTDGIFSDQLGRIDSLSSLDFESTSTYYLQVQVSTSSPSCATGLETLSPRQQITADAWSQTSESVFGSQLQAGGPVGNAVQIGNPAIGHSSSTVTLLSLSTDNSGDETIGASCSTNGTLWYDSTLGRALVCEGLHMTPISNGSTTLGGISIDSTTTFIQAGSVVLSAGANITLSQGASVITINGAAGGGGATLVQFEPYPLLNAASTTLAPLAAQSWFIEPFVAPDAIAPGQLNILVSNSGISVLAVSSKTSFATGTLGSSTGSGVYNQMAALYPRTAGGTSIGSFWSNAWAASMSESINVTTAAATSNLSMNLSMSISYPFHMGTNGAVTYSTFSTSGATSTATSSTATTMLSSIISSILNMFSGQIEMPIPFNTTLSPGQYFLAEGWSSTTGGNAVGANSFMVRSAQVALSSAVGTSYRLFNSTAASTTGQPFMGLGFWTAASSLPPATVNLTDIRNSTSYDLPYFNIQQNTF